VLVVVVPFLVLVLMLVLVLVPESRAPPMVSSELDSTRPSGWWMVVVVRDTVCASVCVCRRSGLCEGSAREMRERCRSKRITRPSGPVYDCVCTLRPAMPPPPLLLPPNEEKEEED
jgi:hypothetical protein